MVLQRCHELELLRHFRNISQVLLLDPDHFPLPVSQNEKVKVAEFRLGDDHVVTVLENVDPVVFPDLVDEDVSGNFLSSFTVIRSHFSELLVKFTLIVGVRVHVELKDHQIAVEADF